MKTLSHISHRVIFYAFATLFLVTPLIFYPLTKYFPVPFDLFGFDPFTYELFEFNKMYFVYLLTAIVSGAWAVRCFSEGRVIFRRTFIDYALILFLLSQFLSTIFSIDVHTSLWGYYSRFHGGLMSSISYVVLYWALVSNLYEQKFLYAFLRFSVISATLVALYGIAQHFGIDAEYWVQNVQARVFSSLGQPNWLAAYLVAMFPISCSFFLFERNLISKIAYGISLVSLFTALVYTGSRSGLLALVVCMVFYSAFVYIKRLRQKETTRLFTFSFLFPLVSALAISMLYVFVYYKFVAIALHVSLGLLFLSFVLLVYSFAGRSRYLLIVFALCILTIGFFSFTPDAFRLSADSSGSSSKAAYPQEAGGTETGKIRFIVWKGAWDIFTHYPVLGSGVESFAYSFYQYRPIALLHTTEWDFLYNKAHNEYMNILATTGVFGFGVYVLYLIHVYVFSILSIRRQSAIESDLSISDLIHSKASLSKTFTPSPSSVTLLIIASMTGFSTILITNFFGFSVVNVGLLFFLFPAFIAGVQTHERKSFIVSLIRKVTQIPSFSQQVLWGREVGIGISSVVVVLVILQISSFWIADIRFAKGRSFNRSGKLGEAHQSFLDALSLRQDEPFYYAELGWTQGNMVYALSQDNDASSAASLAPIAELNARRAVEISPHNVTYWKKLADTYYNLSYFNKDAYINSLLQTSHRAQTLAPTDVSTLLTLSTYYERGGKLDEAYAVVERCSQLKDDLGLAWYRLGELAFRKYQITHDDRYKIQSDANRARALELEPTNDDFTHDYE